jgi:aspartate 1-decarboxylase
MKKLAVVVVLTSLLGACTSTRPGEFKADAVRQDPQLAQAVNLAPGWMSKLPKVNGVIFENGTATSPDFGMADMKAKAMAYAKICVSAGGKVRQQTKIFRSDSGDTSIDQSELTVRSMCPDVDVTGVETVEMKHTSEGNRIRTYVLVALPTGSNNVLKTIKDAAARAPEAFQELDSIVGAPDAPKSNPETVKTSEGELKLMDVENDEYKQKRAEALKKPGAVVGQTTLR